MKKFPPFVVCCMIFAISSGRSLAEQLPLWEAGMGAAGISFPHYRGADQQKNYLLPVPYVVYRGEFLRADRQRIRGLLFESNYAEIDVSQNGTVPVKSKNNLARTGMPDIDPTLELGPSLNLKLMKSADQHNSMELRLPVRAVLASDFRRVHDRGWLFQPQLAWDTADFMGKRDLNLGFTAGPVFANARYHQYIYGVTNAFATATRPAYQGRGGYAGAQFTTALSRRFSDYWVGGFMKYDNLHGAVFEDSPLVKSKSGFSAGIAVVWVFAESKTRVDPHK